MQLIRVLFYQIYTLNDSAEFVALNSRSRATHIIAKLLLNVTETEYKRFINEIKAKYECFSIIWDILRMLEYEHNSDDQKIDDKLEVLNKML